MNVRVPYVEKAIEGIHSSLEVAISEPSYFSCEALQQRISELLQQRNHPDLELHHIGPSYVFQKESGMLNGMPLNGGERS
jgi:hypothetical protein